MTPAAAKTLAECFLKGFFDVYDAMLSQNFTFEVGPPKSADQAAIGAFLQDHPVQLSCVIQEGLGHATILFSKEDTLSFLGALSGGEPKEDISAADKGTLREVAEPALGAGVANLMERAGKGLIQLDGVNIDDTGAAGASGLTASLGGTAIAVLFQFSSAEFTGDAVALFSAGMDSLMPLEDTTKPAGGLTQAALSPDELSDILGGFPSGLEPSPPPAPERRPSLLSSGDRDNIDLVLDIRMLATARLGRMEMPLGDILNLGPGSILEIGHLVDEPIELLINDKLIARGDVVVVDEKFGLRITEIISQKDRIESLR